MTRTLPRQTLFPLADASLARAFADEPVLFDGMKVLFDEKVALYPVRLEHRGERANGRPENGIHSEPDHGRAGR